MPRRNPQRVDPEILAEFVQLAPDVKRKLLAYATRRAHMVANAGCTVSSDEPSILVADAVTDTLTEVVTWDRRYHLSFHLCSVIRTRTSNQIIQARRRAHVPLDSMGENDGPFPPSCLENDQAPARPDALLERARVTYTLYGTVRQRANRDALLVAVLDAYAIGFFKPREVMLLTGITRDAFLNARRRLCRLLAKLPPALLRAALDTMRGAPVSPVLLTTRHGDKRLDSHRL
jgi:hypothetical protein